MFDFLYQLFFITAIFFSHSTGSELSCTYKTNTEWWAINNVYFCEQDFDVDISKRTLDVTNIYGRHSDGKSNSDVKGFRIEKKSLLYFPEKLDNYFKNLLFLAIWEANLNEIHQKDLAPFVELKVLSLYGNNIEVLERNLLKFNPKIEYIGLGQNKIKFVDGKIFNHLKNLHSLHFDGNQCLSRQVGGDKHEVWDLVEEIEEKCSTR